MPQNDAIHGGQSYSGLRMYSFQSSLTNGCSSIPCRVNTWMPIIIKLFSASAGNTNIVGFGLYVCEVKCDAVVGHIAMGELERCAVGCIVVELKHNLACAYVPIVVIADCKLISVPIEYYRLLYWCARLKRELNVPIICRGDARYWEVEVAYATAYWLRVMCWANHFLMP